MDVKDFRAFDCCRSVDTDLVRRVSLLYVFARGNSAIFITKDDEVFGVGHNRSGCLALGHFKDHYRKAQPSLLSDQHLVDVVAGFEHCLGLTASGQCLAWGQNRYGQLGIGTHEPTAVPQLIQELADLRVLQIACGAYFSLALTIDGEVFSWGHNTFAQLGDKTYNSRTRPTQVMIEPIASISCATNNSLAVTATGKVYIWGNNTCGQLGRDPQRDQRGREKPMCNRPCLVTGLGNLQVAKAVCGPNHILCLTSEGYVYAFGENRSGQVGNGTTVSQFTPTKVKIDMKFKDIISHYDNDMSIGISVDDKVFVWGSEQNFLRPHVIPDFGRTTTTLYLRYATNKITYQMVKITGNWPPEANETKNSVNEVINNLSNQKTTSKEIKCEPIFISNHKQLNEVPLEQPIQRDEVSNCDKRSSLGVQSNAGQLFLKCLHKSFNNPNSYDLKITSDDKVIYCHKSVISIRNQEFFRVLSHHLIDGNHNQMEISGEAFEAIYAFIQYMYGIEPQIDIKFVDILQTMASPKLFNEPELEELCAQLNPNNKLTVDETNICSLYQKSITDDLRDLEKSCVVFAANNWKNIFKSDAFHAMDEKLSKRLLTSVFRMSEVVTDS